MKYTETSTPAESARNIEVEEIKADESKADEKATEAVSIPL